MSPRLKTRVAGAWVDTDRAGAARVAGAWVPFAPPSGGPELESLAWAAEPVGTDAVDGTQAYNMGIRVSVTEALTCVGLRWRVPDTVSAPPLGEHVAMLWQDLGNVRLARAAFTPAPGGYQNILFDAPVALETGLNYIASIYTVHYVYRASGDVYPSSPSGKMIADEGRLISSNAGPDAFPGSYPASATGLLFYVSPLVQV